MKTLIKIAWRNCWRNSTRTAIVIFAIIFGIWSSIFVMGFMEGMLRQRTEKAVSVELGDIQIHSNSFDYNADVANVVSDLTTIESLLSQHEGVEAFSSRFRTEAFGLTAHGQRGLKLLGVNAENEAATLALKPRMVEGTFLQSELSYPVLVGQKLADDLKLRLGSKIQLNFTNVDSTQISKNFKVCGIYKVGNDMFDGINVFVPIDRIEKLTGTHLVHEIVVKCSNPEMIQTTADELQAASADNLIESWMTRFPIIYTSVEMMDSIMYVLMIIIILALLFGIINTLVMSILERKRELGVLLAIGMTKNKVRWMIIFESIIYGAIGGPLGITVGYFTMMYFERFGFDLSSLAQGMEAFGYDPIIYMNVSFKYYIVYTMLIVISTIIGGIYPSRMATRLNPIAAIRSV
ncbi:MAG: ABC transporter permease [Reichenbachiella sp.]